MKKNLRIHLFNLTGVDIIDDNQRFANFNKLEIDMKNLPAGVYMLVIPIEDKHLKYKLTKL